MSFKIQLASLMLTLTLPVQAALYTSGSLNGTTIPDNNYLGTGTTLQYTFSGVDPENTGIAYITGMTLNFTLAGGYGGDLTGYLRQGNAENSPYYSLNSELQAYPTISGGGVNFSVDVTSAFAGSNPNDAWTLFFADTSAVGQTTVSDWRLDVTAVPEPANLALVVFGILLVLFYWLRGGLKKAMPESFSSSCSSSVFPRKKE